MLFYVQTAQNEEDNENEDDQEYYEDQENWKNQEKPIIILNIWFL